MRNFLFHLPTPPCALAQNRKSPYCRCVDNVASFRLPDKVPSMLRLVGILALAKRGMLTSEVLATVALIRLCLVRNEVSTAPLSAGRRAWRPVNLYAESSAVLAWLLDEAAAPEGRRLLGTASVVVASDLTLIECDRVLLQASALGEFSEADSSDRRAHLVVAASQ